MKGCSSKGSYSAVGILCAIALQACAPLTDGASGNTGNCLAAVIANNGTVGIGQVNSPALPNTVTAITTQAVAQSFPANSGASFSSVSLNLDAVYPVGTTPSGSIKVDIEPDSLISTSGNATPTTPGGSSLGSATLSIAGTTIPTQAQGPAFVAFDFSPAISLNAGQIYWIVATPSYTPSATVYVEWRYASTQLLNQIGAYFSTLTSQWITLGTTINMDFKVGC